MTENSHAVGHPSLWTGFRSLLGRDILIAIRERSDVVQPVLFFLVVVSLFPLSMTPDQEMLRNVGPGIIWVVALLANLLALDSIFRPDYEDGNLEQILLSPQPLSMLVLAKTVAHWLTTALPLIVVSPVLAMLMHLPADTYPVLIISLLLGTPSLSLIGAVGVGLTLGIRKNGALMSLLTLPLCVPTLIFGAGAVQAVMISQNPSPHLLLLASFSLFSLVVCPFAAAAAIRISLN